MGLFLAGRVRESFDVAQPLFGAASEGSDRNAGVSILFGQLLQDREGEALIAEASAELRAGGVVNPARFAAALLPGLELP
jgi:hypothetical protein